MFQIPDIATDIDHETEDKRRRSPRKASRPVTPARHEELPRTGITNTARSFDQKEEELTKMKVSKVKVDMLNRESLDSH